MRDLPPDSPELRFATGSGEPSLSLGRSERRANRRYPITADLCYRILNRKKVIESGRGRTIDVSSTGVLFEAPLTLPRGLKIEICIDWPALSDRLELFAEGRIVRGRKNYTAVHIRKFSFREKQERASDDALSL